MNHKYTHLARYKTYYDPAPNADVLLDFLLSEEKGGEHYIYRGQLREWPGPLLPSLYRRSIQRQRVLTEQDSEFRELRLRGSGVSFIEMQPDSALSKLIMDSPQGAINLETYTGLLKLSRSLEFSVDVCQTGHKRAFLSKIPSAQHKTAKLHLSLWRTIIDEIHQADIRQYGFLQPYAYVLGMTLAQQYGFASEFLDFTSSVAVAIFFATHSYPNYLFTPRKSLAGTDVGVVYRLPSNGGEIAYKQIDAFNYYTCPSQVHMQDVCGRFEDDSAPTFTDQSREILAEDENWEELMAIMLNGGMVIGPVGELIMSGTFDWQGQTKDSIDRYLHLYYNGGGRRFYRLLNVPPGTFGQSRLGRQAAVAVIPDELRRTESERGHDYASFQAVEDVSRRPGCERFYFRHTDTPPGLGHLCREYLWPKENDFYEDLISRVLDPGSKPYSFQGNIVPKRIDLISRGYY